MRNAERVYAVIRIDGFQMAAGDYDKVSVEVFVKEIIEHIVTVKEIVTSVEQAEAEVERLNNLNADKGVRYFWQPTRLIVSNNGITC